MSWYYFKPTQRIETDEGIKTKSQRGDFVKNWWATRWLTAMERVMDRGRLQRGRTYARQGQVLSLEEKQGKITAQVQGSRPNCWRGRCPRRLSRPSGRPKLNYSPANRS